MGTVRSNIVFAAMSEYVGWNSSWKKNLLDQCCNRTYFENVLLLVRNIANPDDEDEFFTTWRHKDWFQGNSWASGIAVTPLNGRNQESSSEAIAAYEAVALYGSVMVSFFVGLKLGVCPASNVRDS